MTCLWKHGNVWTLTILRSTGIENLCTVVFSRARVACRTILTTQALIYSSKSIAAARLHTERALKIPCLLWQSWWRSTEKLRRSCCVSLAMMGQEKSWWGSHEWVYEGGVGHVWGHWDSGGVYGSSHRWEWAYWDQGSASSSLLFALVDWQVGRWGCEGVSTIADDIVICSESGEEEETLRGGGLLFWFSPLQLLSVCLCFLSLLSLSVCSCMDSSQVPTSGLTHLR